MTVFVEVAPSIDSFDTIQEAVNNSTVNHEQLHNNTTIV